MEVVVRAWAGFLGSHLTDRLLDEGYSLRGIDNLSTGERRNLAHMGGSTASF